MSNKGKHYQKYQVRIARAKNDGRSKEHLYHVLAWMKGRCYCPTSTAYKHYGQRGITICDEWKYDYPTFRNWAFNTGYIDGQDLEIDRIDVNGNYEPSNCRWVSRKENINNRRCTTYLNYNGIKKCASEVCELTGRSQTYVRKHYPIWE